MERYEQPVMEIEEIRDDTILTSNATALAEPVQENIMK